MIKALKDVERVREIASHLDELGAPQKITNKVRKWANDEAKRLRNEAHGWS